LIILAQLSRIAKKREDRHLRQSVATGGILISLCQVVRALILMVHCGRAWAERACAGTGGAIGAAPFGAFVQALYLSECSRGTTWSARRAAVDDGTLTGREVRETA
jgi:hypothetical protein